ncbi:hypothetical protein [Paenibacillus cisolokensis]|uniref:hypothetical protein n=1 Tax=Paenibacillus cisolokensis TaxID=1658519 RepID=UPI001BCF4F2B|nr:hypothetical protein [Paenibacillus cisolokensis]
MVQVDGQKVVKAAEACLRVLLDPEYRNRMVEHNFRIAEKHWSYPALAEHLAKLF